MDEYTYDGSSGLADELEELRQAVERLDAAVDDLAEVIDYEPESERVVDPEPAHRIDWDFYTTPGPGVAAEVDLPAQSAVSVFNPADSPFQVAEVPPELQHLITVGPHAAETSVGVSTAWSEPPVPVSQPAPQPVAETVDDESWRLPAEQRVTFDADGVMTIHGMSDPTGFQNLMTEAALYPERFPGVSPGQGNDVAAQMANSQAGYQMLRDSSAALAAQQQAAMETNMGVDYNYSGWVGDRV